MICGTLVYLSSNLPVWMWLMETIRHCICPLLLRACNDSCNDSCCLCSYLPACRLLIGLMTSCHISARHQWIKLYTVCNFCRLCLKEVFKFSCVVVFQGSGITNTRQDCFLSLFLNQNSQHCQNGDFSFSTQTNSQSLELFFFWSCGSVLMYYYCEILWNAFPLRLLFVP